MRDAKVFLDIDGVMADLVEAIADFHKLPNPFGEKSNLGKYFLHELIGLTEKEIWEPLSEDFWANLPLTAEAERIMSTILEFFPEEQVCFLSAPTQSPSSAAGKMIWIKKHFPSFWSDRRFLLGAAKHFCASEKALLIDDHEANITRFIQNGGRAVLYPRPWNSLHCFGSDEGLSLLRAHLLRFTTTIM